MDTANKTRQFFRTTAKLALLLAILGPLGSSPSTDRGYMVQSRWNVVHAPLDCLHAPIHRRRSSVCYAFKGSNGEL